MKKAFSRRKRSKVSVLQKGDPVAYIMACVLQNPLLLTETATRFKMKVEDALYWIIQLSRSSRDMESAARYKKIYLQRYLHGRWIEEIRMIDVSVLK